ncbi:MAG: PAS domain S-box protein [Alphaproteobacteria bacterium]
MAKLRILTVEDEDTGLRQALGDGVTASCVRDRAGLEGALVDADWDVVVCDLSSARVSADMVLDAVRARRPYIPVIAVVESLGEEAVADLMRAGARDVVLKANVARLRAAVKRETDAREESTNALRDAQRLLESVSSNIPGDIFRRVLHSGGRISYPFFSSNFLKAMGISAAEASSHPGLFRDRTHPEDQAAYEAAYAESTRTLSKVDHVRRVKLPTSEYRWVRTIAQPRRVDGTVIWDGVALDVTREFEAETARQKAHERLADGIEAIPDAFALFDAADRLVTCNQKYREAGPAYADKIVPGTRFEDILDLWLKDNPQNMAEGKTALWKAERMARHRNPSGPFEIKLADGRVWRIQESKTRLGDIVHLRTDITNRVAREREFALRSAQFDLILDAVDQGIMLLDKASNIAAMNRRARELLDVPPELTRPGTPVERLLRFNAERGEYGPVTVEAAMGRMFALIRSPTPSVVERTRPNGTVLEVRNNPAFDGGFVGVYTDITERKRAELALRESVARLEGLAANLPGVLYQRIRRADGRFDVSYVSEGFERLWGYTAAEVKADPSVFLEKTFVDGSASIVDAMEESLRTMQPFVWSGPERAKDGRIIWTQTLGRPRQLPNGDVAWDGISFDISEQRRVEEELRQSKARLESLAENLPGVVYQRIRHADGHVTYPYLSKGAQEIYGYTAEELMADSAPFRNAAVPEDQEWHDKGADLSAESMQPWIWEGRIRRKDGRIRWVHVHARPRALPEGAVAWDGVVLDITDRIRAEQAARENANQIESLAANLPGIVYRRVQHPGGRVEFPFISPSVRDLFGYTAKELMADPTPFQQVASAEEQKEHDEAAARSAEALKPWQTECRIRHRDGTIKWIHISAQPHRRDDGAIVWDGVTLDISDRKFAELELGARARQQAAVVALGQRALAMEALSVLFDAAAETVARTLGITLASILELDPRRETLRLVAGYGWPESAIGKATFPNLESVPAGHALKTRRPVIITDLAGDSRFRAPAALKAQGVVSGLSIVIGPPERPFGTLSAFTRARREFSAQDADFLRAVANVLAAAVEREHTEQERWKLSSVVEQSPNAIAIADAKGSIEYANHALEAMMGFSREEFVGKHTLQWANRRSRDERSRMIRDTVFSGGIWREEHQDRKKNGEVFWCREMILGIKDSVGRIANVTSIREDVTERKQVEAQLAQGSKLSTLGEMASGLTHELNQPLNIIRMAADSCLILMEENAIDEDHWKQQLEVISGQTERMAEIINHMRIFSRKDRVEVEPFDPSNSVRAAVRLISEQLRLSEIGLSTSIPATCRPVLGHPLRLEQVVINLLNNAKDAVLEHRARSAGHGGIELELVDDRKANTIGIHITDTGGGIAHDVIEHIFEPFYTTKDPGKGTGLGLSIVYAIVTSMGGAISAMNTKLGVRFTVSLPVDPGFGSKRERRAIKRGGAA